MNELISIIISNQEIIQVVLNFFIALGAVIGIFISISALIVNRKQILATHIPFIKLDSLSYKNENYNIKFDQNWNVVDSNMHFLIKNVGSDLARGITIYVKLNKGENTDSENSSIEADYSHIESTLGKDESVDISHNIYSMIGKVHFDRLSGVSKHIETLYLEFEITYYDIFSQKYKTDFTLSLDYKNVLVLQKGEESHIFYIRLFDMNLPLKTK